MEGKKNSLDTVQLKGYKPVVLLVLDGWGLSPIWGGNVIEMAMPKNFYQLWRQYPHRVLQALRAIQPTTTSQQIAKKNWIKVGNSAIGHAMIGSGRLLKFDIDELNEAIESGNFFHNSVLQETYANLAAKPDRGLHLIGLISDGGVHSHLNHLLALLKLAKEYHLTKVFIHAITDGIDVADGTALHYLQQIKEGIAENGAGEIASVTGRIYAMDRSNNWSKINGFQQLLLRGRAKTAATPEEAVSASYRRGWGDELIPPTIMADCQQDYLRPGETVICFNTRADRMRQLVTALTKQHCDIVTMTDYFAGQSSKYNTRVAFPPATIKQTLPEIISQAGLRQLRIAESEKYAHVTYFFNGGREEPLAQEERLIIKSADVTLTRKHPAMAVPKIAAEAVKKIQDKAADFILINFGNVDMVAHTGDLLAGSRAVQAADQALGKIAEAVLAVNGALVITADHGNAEQMVSIEAIGERETLHTLNPVPLIVVTRQARRNLLSEALIGANSGTLAEIVQSRHTLADVAPTVLKLMNLKVPEVMEGKPLCN